MNRITKLLLFLFLFPLVLLSQKMSVEEADSLYRFFKQEPIEDYQILLETGLQLKDHFQGVDDTCMVAKLSSRTAKSYERLGSLDSALHELQTTERWALHCDPKVYLANIIGQASVYIELQRWEKVVYIIDRAEEEVGFLLPDTVFNEVLVNKAIALVYLGRIDEAKKVFRSYYNDAVRSNDYESQQTALINLGALSGYTEDLDSASYYLNKALDLCGIYPCANQLEILQNLATLASLRDDYQKSKYYLDSAISTATRVKDLRSQAELHREIAITLKGLEKYEDAVGHLLDHSNLKDSVNKKDIIERVVKYQELFESEKKNRKIKELELDNLGAVYRESKLRQRQRLILVSGGIVLILVIGLWSRLRYIKRTSAIIKKEKERSENLLLNILPAEVAEELKENGKSEARDFDNVTVLFTDFMSFTETASKLSAKELVQEVNICFKAFDGIIQKYQIEKIKTIGDAYMAAGGLHTPRTAEPEDVVKAAIEMQQFLTARFEDRSSEELPAFQMRVGVHTGPVVAGIVGVKKFQYDIWGDTVNTASRMENYGAAGKVNISGSTYGILRGIPGFAFQERQEIEVKGKGKMKMWFVSIT